MNRKAYAFLFIMSTKARLLGGMISSPSAAQYSEHRHHFPTGFLILDASSYAKIISRPNKYCQGNSSTDNCFRLNEFPPSKTSRILLCRRPPAVFISHSYVRHRSPFHVAYSAVSLNGLSVCRPPSPRCSRKNRRVPRTFPTRESLYIRKEKSQ